MTLRPMAARPKKNHYFLKICVCLAFVFQASRKPIKQANLFWIPLTEDNFEFWSWPPSSPGAPRCGPLGIRRHSGLICWGPFLKSSRPRGPGKGLAKSGASPPTLLTVFPKAHPPKSRQTAFSWYMHPPDRSDKLQNDQKCKATQKRAPQICK